MLTTVIGLCRVVQAREATSIVEKEQWKGCVAGTRKTTPGFRIVEKYSLLVGGIATHRHDLSQMVMLKENHIWSCGSIAAAVNRAKEAAGFSMKIEVILLFSLRIVSIRIMGIFSCFIPVWCHSLLSSICATSGGVSRLE